MAKITEHFTDVDFFRPLVSKYNQFYFDIMDAMMRESEVSSVIHEDDMRDMIRTMLCDVDDDDLRKDPSQLYVDLCRAGWVDNSTIGQSGKVVTILSPDATGLVKYLHRAASKRELFNARDVLGLLGAARQLASGEGRPVQDSLPEISERIQAIRGALINLRNDASKRIATFVQDKPLNTLINEFLLGDEMGNLFEEYFYLRRDGFVSRIFHLAQEYIEEFEADEGRMADAALTLAETAADTDLAGLEPYEARERLGLMINSMIMFLSRESEELLSDIDAEMNACVDAVNVGVILALRFGEDNHARIVELMRLTSEAPDEIAEEILQEAGDAVPLLRIDTVSAESPMPFRKGPRDVPKTVLEESGITDDALDKAIKEYELSGKRTEERIKERIESALDGRGSFTAGKGFVEDWKEDAIFLSELMTRTGKEGEAFPYKISLTGRIVESDVAEYNEIRVRRSEKWQ